MKKIVVIGGGHGQATILRGLKDLNNVEITAVVTVADDGGSTGRLRNSYDIPAMGDIRNVMVALSRATPLFSSLMEYRFESGNQADIEGHSLGNLILTALTAINQDFMVAVSSLSQVLNVAGTILPATTETVTLQAEMADGKIIKGESSITNYHGKIQRLFYERPVKATPEVIESILTADLILLGIGSLYTSIMSNLIIEEIAQAILASPAKLMYMCNIMSQPGETDGYDVLAHAAVLEKQIQRPLDVVVLANDEIPPAVLARYQEQQAFPVSLAEGDNHFQVLTCSLLDDFASGFVRHQPDKLTKFFQKYLEL